MTIFFGEKRRIRNILVGGLNHYERNSFNSNYANVYALHIFLG